MASVAGAGDAASPPAGAGGALPLAPGAVVEAGDPSVYVLPCAPGSRRLELRLVVKCGSALERDDERGFAHFCEHLAFRTTTNYASGGVVDWLRTACESNLQPDFNVRVCEWFDTSTSAVLRELAESNRFVQKSAASTWMWPS